MALHNFRTIEHPTKRCPKCGGPVDATYADESVGPGVVVSLRQPAYPDGRAVAGSQVPLTASYLREPVRGGGHYAAGDLAVHGARESDYYTGDLHASIRDR